MKHPRSSKPVAEARSLVWYHVNKVPQSKIAAFVGWCRENKIHPVGRGRASDGVISLQFDTADAYRVTAWFRDNGIIVRRYTHADAQQSP
jgi:hypothetical protein